ncbi:hypothetical protein L228DRAFT_258209 [Xylona heveae TC161]|uniref:RING-type E3 ubiquitin transferase n=1 Tax=Xylona heveae (strain CBS 132557 / TC161) TaxID=1328760 RepID=A0A165K093_XYLHT|nr:hypothetical protein L228DRAFT_258209 [Xylona heveae TC161]KZF26844.1 hypothetical protein L228DRAFT_258209 [Xylona heveae TC161]
MDSQTTTGPRAQASAETGPARHSAGRDSRRGGRGGQNAGRADGQRGGARGGERRGRGGRGKGGPSGRGPNSATDSVAAPGHRARGNFGTRLTGDATQAEDNRKVAKPADAGAEVDEEEDDDSEVCFICASPVIHQAVSPCNHRTCHICALRLRALYKTKACAHCRTNADYVIFTDHPSKRYEEFEEKDFAKSDDILGVKYEKNEIFEDTVLLLRYNCPDPDCDVACLGWPDLHRHVKSTHHKVMCDLCTRNKKVFTHEHELFTANELRKHERHGDNVPGAADQSGFKGHPECGFCKMRFYGDDELYTHCRDRHERCHLCDRRDGLRFQYYVNYDALELHFKKDHFLCPDQECLDKKFVVFDSEMDLKAHQLEAHPNGLSKDARRDARRVDLSTFGDFRAPHHFDGRSRREGRGRGRGRDPNSEALPVSTAQPLRRDEIAFQRQRAIQSAQSVTTSTFGTQLSSTEAYAARPPPQSATPQTVTTAQRDDSFPALQNLNINNNNTPNGSSSQPSQSLQNLPPQEQARRMRHAAVTERATAMLRNDPSKVSQFRNKISAFRSSSISASELIDSFFSLFDTSSSELGKLVKELADIFEIDSKRTGLLKAWSDWRAINEDYPALPGPSGILPGASSSALGSGGSRVLKLKSSTAQSSRSAINKQNSWGTAASPSSSSATSSSAANAFPALPSASAPSSNRAGASKSTTAPSWAGATPSGPAGIQPTSSSLSSYSRPAPKASSRGTPTVNSADAFPALPAAAKPTSTIFGYGSGAVRRDFGASRNTANAWASDAQAAADADLDTDGAGAAGGAGGGGGKRKGKKKQTLFHFG